MVTAAKKQAAEELRKIKALAKASKAEAKAVAAKRKAKLDKRDERMDRRASGVRGAKGVLVSSSDIKDPEMAKELAAEAHTIVPAHRHDVHVKKERVTVYVTLHSVPPQKIDVDATTDSTLIVATPKHNKPYRLEFPFPHGMKVDSAAGDYEFESGVLKCEFPVTKMPADVVRAWTDRLESIRKSQRARFDVDKEGELVVRRRKTRLELDTKDAQKAAAAEKKAAQLKAAKADPAPSTAGKKTDAKKKAPAAADAKKAAVPPAPVGAGGASAKPGTGAKDDKAAMLKIAAQSATAVSQSLRGRMNVARSAHERRVARAKVTLAKKDGKESKMQNAFAKVLHEKRSELQRREERIAPVAAKKGGASNNKNASPSKAVRFA